MAIGKDGDAACVRGDRTFKERFISWFPRLSQWIGVSLSGEEKQANIAASNEFISALTHCLGEDRATAALSDVMLDLSRGLPLTARKVADILLKEDVELDRYAAKRNAKNRTAFYQWYSEHVGECPKKRTPERAALRALVTGCPEAYQRTLTENDFVQLALNQAEDALGQVRSAAGMVFTAEDAEELDQAIEDLQQDEALLAESLKRLVYLKSIADKSDTDLHGRIDGMMTQVSAQLAQTRADLYPEQLGTLVVEKQAFPEGMRTSLAKQYTEDAKKEHTDSSSYWDASGIITTEPGDMLIRKQGLGNDFGRCDIKLNGEAIPKDTENNVVIGKLLNAFQDKYGKEKGALYLKQLSNTLGQALFAGVLTRNMLGEGVTTDNVSAVPGNDPKYAAQVSYAIELKEDGVHVSATYRKSADSIMQNPMNADCLSVAADPDESYTEVTLDLLFNPEDVDGKLFTVNEVGSSYEHKIVPKTHDQVRESFEAS